MSMANKRKALCDFVCNQYNLHFLDYVLNVNHGIYIASTIVCCCCWCFLFHSLRNRPQRNIQSDWTDTETPKICSGFEFSTCCNWVHFERKMVHFKVKSTTFQLTILHARKTERFNDSRAHFDVFGLTEISPISRITFVVVVNSIEFFRNRVREQHVYFTIYISYVVWNLSHFSKWFFVHSFARSHFAIQWKLGLRAVAFICFLFMSKSLKI